MKKFTLIEFFVVMSIIIILVVMFIPALQAIKHKNIKQNALGETFNEKKLNKIIKIYPIKKNENYTQYINRLKPFYIEKKNNTTIIKSSTGSMNFYKINLGYNFSDEKEIKKVKYGIAESELEIRQMLENEPSTLYKIISITVIKSKCLLK